MIERSPQEQGKMDRVSRAMDELVIEGKLEKITDPDGTERYLNADPESDGDPSRLVSDRVHGLTKMGPPKAKLTLTDEQNDAIDAATKEMLSKGLIQAHKREADGVSALSLPGEQPSADDPYPERVMRLVAEYAGLANENGQAVLRPVSETTRDGITTTVFRGVGAAASPNDGEHRARVARVVES